jgi:hypothetical protein
MTIAAISVVDEAVRSIDRLIANLKKDSSRQVRSGAERSLIRATAHAWFHSHRTQLEDACDPSLLDTVGASFTSILELADRDTTRSRHLEALGSARKKLIAMRSAALNTSRTPKAPATTGAPPDFSPLVQDPKMRDILDRRWKETRSCLEANAHLAATVMMGGLLEGILLARVNRVQPSAPVFTAASAPKDRTGKTLQLKDWMLKDFLDVAHDLRWISRSAKDVGAVVRDYRNYIHPQKEFTHGITLGGDETSVLWSVFETVSRQILDSVQKTP